ncbi:hypothetical protein FACS1894122_13730 [Alphaproteobacteria bacterium]|nr:hypothetical protein FACS1894122_13730 [Alphaproteobacteria bacterium]
MNKVVVVLGIIVLMTLSGLFFCVGFFTGTTIFPSRLTSIGDDVKDTEKSMTLKDIEDITDARSGNISEKVVNILASAAETATEKVSTVIKYKNYMNMFGNDNKLTVDSLLREIAASHSAGDDCSYDKTVTQSSIHKPHDEHLKGKKIVFIGYFKNNVAMQIQKLLIGKGYKAHVEKSKSGDGSESFVFCGPFKKEENANALVLWLLKHDFSEARTISVSNDAIEETLYDFESDDSNMPANDEKDIPVVESNISTISTATADVSTTIPEATTVIATPAATVDYTPVPAATVDYTPVPAATVDYTPVPAATVDYTATPAATIDYTATPAATIDYTATPAATVDYTATPAATVDYTAAPAATVDYTAAPAATVDYTATPAATVDYTAVPAAPVDYTAVPPT